MNRRLSVAVLALLGVITLGGCDVLGRLSVPLGSPTFNAAPSGDPQASADGSVVAFVSDAPTLVAGDTNGVADVFVRDMAAQTTARVSLRSAGGESAGASSEPAVSGDGRVVAFVSSASDLVAGDGNGVADVFVRDRVAGTTERVSLPSTGGESTGASSEPAVSGDGRFVAFVSSAADLVAGDSNGLADVFVRDRVAGTTTRVSVTAGAAQVAGASTAPSITASGDWVAFESTASTLVSGDSNGVADVFVARRTGGTVRRASAPDAISRPFQQSNGASRRPQVVDPIGGYLGSGDPVVAYASDASNLSGTDGNGSGSDTFLTTYVFGSLARTVRLSEGTTSGRTPGLGVLDGGPGVVVSYVRGGGSGPDQVVSVERESPISTEGLEVRPVSTTLTGGAANGPSDEPSQSADGRFVTFSSTAGDLASGSAASSAGEVFLTRANRTAATSVEPGRIGVGETRQLTVRGRGFEPTSGVSFDAGVTVSAVQYVSPTELVITATGTATVPGDPRRDVRVLTPGAGGALVGTSGVTCEGCVEIAAVVDQPGPVDIQITGGVIDVGAASFPLPSCTGTTCPALPATVSSDGELSFGVASLELDPIPIPVELFAGVTTTVEVVPAFVAPEGQVIPANGATALSLGFALKLRAPLLPASCAVGPVQASLSAGPGGDPEGVAYDQGTGEAGLVGGFTESLAVTGCGLFTGVLNSVLGLPVDIADNRVELGVRFAPVLTGSVVP